jgi:hypothetical protein
MDLLQWVFHESVPSELLKKILVYFTFYENCVLHMDEFNSNCGGDFMDKNVTRLSSHCQCCYSVWLMHASSRKCTLRMPISNPLQNSTPQMKTNCISSSRIGKHTKYNSGMCHYTVSQKFITKLWRNELPPSEE